MCPCKRQRLTGVILNKIEVDVKPYDASETHCLTELVSFEMKFTLILIFDFWTVFASQSAQTL